MTILLSSVVAVLLITVITVTLGQPQNNTKTSSPAYSMNKVKSGLFISDSLKNGNLTREQLFEFNQKYNHVWTLYGSAVARKAPVAISENTAEGLSLGIKAAVKGNWAGYFAMTRDDYASLFHAVMTIPAHSLAVAPSYTGPKDERFSVGLYVQTSIIYGNINYVGCVGESGPDGRKWRVETGTGNTTQVTQEHDLPVTVLGKSEPLTRDCTIITNGDNYLRVYLDNRLVFASDKLNLQMPRPFNSYLEVQTTYSDKNLYGKFKDYYSTGDENVEVINAPVGGSVKIIGTASSSKVLAYAPIDQRGIANLNIGQNHFPLTGQIRVFNSTNHMVTSSASNSALFGGDIYSAAPVSLLERWTLR
jgi:hypothetical protein